MQQDAYNYPRIWLAALHSTLQCNNSVKCCMPTHSASIAALHQLCYDLGCSACRIGMYHSFTKAPCASCGPAPWPPSCAQIAAMSAAAAAAASCCCSPATRITAAASRYCSPVMRSWLPAGQPHPAQQSRICICRCQMTVSKTWHARRGHQLRRHASRDRLGDLKYSTACSAAMRDCPQYKTPNRRRTSAGCRMSTYSGIISVHSCLAHLPAASFAVPLPVIFSVDLFAVDLFAID